MKNRFTIVCKKHIFQASLLALGLLAGCASDKSTIQKASLANDQLAPAVMKDPELANYLQSIGNRVIASAKAPSRIKRGTTPGCSPAGCSSIW